MTSLWSKLPMSTSVNFLWMGLNVWVVFQCLSYTTSIISTSIPSLRVSLPKESPKTSKKEWTGNLSMICLHNRQERASQAGNLPRERIHLLQVILRNTKRKPVLLIGMIPTEAQKNIQSMNQYMVSTSPLIYLRMNTLIKMECLLLIMALENMVWQIWISRLYQETRHICPIMWWLRIL